MDDDKLTQLFTGFAPRLSDDGAFMARLERNLRAVDEAVASRCRNREEAVAAVRRERTSLRRRCRRAVAVAAVAGFAVGTLFTLALPHIGQAVAAMLTPLASLASLPAVTADACRVLAWLIVGGASVAAALSAYDVALASAHQGTRP